MHEDELLTVGLARVEVVDGSVVECERRERTRRCEPLLVRPSSNAEHKERQKSQHNEEGRGKRERETRSKIPSSVSRQEAPRREGESNVQSFVGRSKAKTVEGCMSLVSLQGRAHMSSRSEEEREAQRINEFG